MLFCVLYNTRIMSMILIFPDYHSANYFSLSLSLYRFQVIQKIIEHEYKRILKIWMHGEITFLINSNAQVHSWLHDYHIMQREYFISYHVTKKENTFFCFMRKWKQNASIITVFKFNFLFMYCSEKTANIF
jgi:hypothetical protein